MALLSPSNLAVSVVSEVELSLTWQNHGSYDFIEVWSREENGNFALLATITGTLESYSDSGLADGRRYYYELQGMIVEPEQYSGFSGEAFEETPLYGPSGLAGVSIEPTKIRLDWTNNTYYASGCKIYQDGVEIGTAGAGTSTYTATGLTGGQTYHFKVKAYNDVAESTFSNEVEVLAYDPPAAPSDLAVQSLSTTSLRLTWVDNSGNEADFHIERSADGSTGWTEIATVSANVSTYDNTGLVQGTVYYYRVRAHNVSDYSEYSNVAHTSTLDAIAQPANLVATAFASYVEIEFQDNSTEEDGHSVERKAAGGSYSEVVELAPDRTFWRDATVVAGTHYYYRVRARAAADYSDYSNEADTTALSAPAAPTGLAVSDYQDQWIRLAWMKTSGETGYKIEKSTNGTSFTEIAKIGAGIESFKATGLSPSTQYWFKVRAYNGVGNSDYTSTVNQTTRAAYLPSRFEKLIRRPSPKLIFLVEVNPLKVLSGWTKTAGKTYVYECAFAERGAAIDAVYERGEALMAEDSINDVDVAAGSWYQDIPAGKVYVHTSGGGNPSFYFYTASFWLYFTSWQRGTTVFNGNYYLPLVPADGIPDISQEIQPYYEGNFTVSTGTVSLINGKINKQFFFDKRFANYVWRNRKVIIKAGGDGFTYSEFKTINTGIINSTACDDRRFTMSLRDYRDGLHKTLGASKYSIYEFPSLDENAKDRIKGFGFGPITDAVPVCIDTVNRIFEFHHGRCKEVDKVTQNGTTLTAGTDYFVDYANGRIKLARGLAYATQDIILVDFHGAVNSADEEISNGAEIFKYLMNEELSLADSDLDLDAIYETKYARTKELSLYLWKEQNSEDVIRMIEHSIQVYSLQDSDGRLGLRVPQTAAPGDIKYINEPYVFDVSIEQNQDSVFSEIDVYYGESQKDDKFSRVERSINQATWKYRCRKSLDVYTALGSEADAEALAQDIQDILDLDPITFSVPRILFTCLPGDLIYFNRSRFYSAGGMANNLLLRLLGISKLISSGKTQIKAEVVA